MRARTSLAILAAAAATPAIAQDGLIARASLDMVGYAPSACLIGRAPRGTGTNAVLAAAGARQADIRIVELVDPTTSQPRPTSISLSLPVVCNVSHQIIVRTQNGGLARDNREGGLQAEPGFRETVPYGVTARWAGVVATGQSGVPFELIAPDAAAGDLTLDIEIMPGGQPLVAGSYSDELVVELRVAT